LAGLAKAKQAIGHQTSIFAGIWTAQEVSADSGEFSVQLPTPRFLIFQFSTIKSNHYA
jgi:hypothetical protein